MLANVVITLTSPFHKRIISIWICIIAHAVNAESPLPMLAYTPHYLFIYKKKWRITISSTYIFSYICIAKYNHYKNHTKNL